MADDLTTWRLLIPDYWPPSLNQTQHAHWSRVRKHKARAMDHIAAYGTIAGDRPRFVGHVNVKLTRLYGGRRQAMDKDNLYGSAKCLIDALRRPRGRSGGLGIIEDDDPALLTLVVEQLRTEAPGLACVIEIQGMRDGDADDAPQADAGPPSRGRARVRHPMRDAVFRRAR